MKNEEEKKESDMNPQYYRNYKYIMKVINENGFTDAEIILFGSRAKGNFRTHSDWDFLIV
jgi:predicted nucleotidyltransferase